jgi:hypothetical protein
MKTETTGNRGDNTGVITVIAVLQKNTQAFGPKD